MMVEDYDERERFDRVLHELDETRWSRFSQHLTRRSSKDAFACVMDELERASAADASAWPKYRGCGFSSHAEAKASALPPPRFGFDTKVRIKKKWFSSDFNVDNLTVEFDEDGEPKPVRWMLMDAVGKKGDTTHDYYLKYRAIGDDASTVLGCANLQHHHDYMWFNVTYSHQHRGHRPPTFDQRHRRWEDLKVNADFVVARRVRFYEDHEQQSLTGRLEVVGRGHYTRHLHTERYQQRRERHTEENGHKRVDVYWTPESRTHGFTRCNLKAFVYKLSIYGTDFNIAFDEKASGKWYKSNKMIFKASHASSGAPLFMATSDGEKKTTIQTYSHGDPVSSILAAFCVSIRLDPKELHSTCKSYCKKHISLHAPTGIRGGFGMNDVEYEQRFIVPGRASVSVAPMPPVGHAYGVPVAEAPPPPPPLVVAEPVVAAEPMVGGMVTPFTVMPGEAVAFEPIVVDAIVLPAITDDVAAALTTYEAKGDGQGKAVSVSASDDDGDGGDDDTDGVGARGSQVVDNGSSSEDEKAYFTTRDSC